MVTSTGKIIPSGSFAVLALYCLQKSMMFTPWGPSAVPTGGAVVAFPAGNCNLMVVCIFFGGIFLLPQILCALCARFASQRLSELFDAGKIQFHRSGASKNCYRNFQAAVIVVDLFHGTVEIGERAVDDTDLLVALVDNFRLRAILRGVHAVDDGVHFRFGQSRRRGGRTDKAGNARRVAHDV